MKGLLSGCCRISERKCKHSGRRGAKDHQRKVCMCVCVCCAWILVNKFYLIDMPIIMYKYVI